VNARGVKSGCTEEIRQKNLLACGNAPIFDPKAYDKKDNKVWHKTDLCRHTVADATRRPLVAHGCFSSLGTCHSLGHDKSKCFLQTVVRGPENVERERWYASFPFVTDDWREVDHDHRKWPYHSNHAGAVEGKKVPANIHARFLLMNPQNGNAVVCSMEDWGNHRLEDEPNSKVDAAAVEKNEFKGKWSRAFGLSPETRWKLAFKDNYAHVVLFAFVPANTPLGPVPEGTLIQLRKRATYLQIMGVEKVPEKAEEAK
jgi:hypothetical protein